MSIKKRSPRTYDTYAYDDDTIESATAKAKSLGRVVAFPAADELFVDIDTPAAMRRFSRESAPTPETRPMFWVAAHVRKMGEGLPTLEDVSGSTQRAGAADVVITMAATRDTGGNVLSVKVGFPKRREKDVEDRLDPVSFRQARDRYETIDAPVEEARPLRDRILEKLTERGEPMSKTALGEALGRSNKDIGDALGPLFAERLVRTTTLKGRNGKDYDAIKLRIPEGDGMGVNGVGDEGLHHLENV